MMFLIPSLSLRALLPIPERSRMGAVAERAGSEKHLFLGFDGVRLTRVGEGDTRGDNNVGRRCVQFDFIDHRSGENM